MNRFALILLAAVGMASCAEAPADRNTGDAKPVNGSDTADRLVHPEWSKNAVIYEMNVRQHTAKGDLATAMGDLARLKQLGVDILWLMPVHPIGEVNRKGERTRTITSSSREVRRWAVRTASRTTRGSIPTTARGRISMPSCPWPTNTG